MDRRTSPLVAALLTVAVGVSVGARAAPPCSAAGGASPVQAPVFVTNLSGSTLGYQTGWFASPVVADLDHDGVNELVAALYDIFVFSPTYTRLDRTSLGASRVYAPHVVADLDGDGITEVVIGNGALVYAFEWRDGALAPKPGWPADTTCFGSAAEVRGLAAADLDGDGTVEVVATTTQTLSTAAGGSQVFVFSADGGLFQPAGGHVPAWPRYNNLPGAGNDADRNCQGHSGFGAYGLNVAVGDIDDDPDLEVVVTYDNHAIQAFDPDGVALDASTYFTNRSGECLGYPFTWGQFIRWADPQVEEDHYHLHTGAWPNPTFTEWLQWTASPPNVVDLDGDGADEVVAVPNVELEEATGYVTQAYAVMVLEGAHGDGSRSARRKAGWEDLPRGGAPVSVSGWYPPRGVPAATTVDIQGDARPEIVVSLNDGRVHAFDADATELWSVDYRHGKPIMFSSEVTVADLNRDGTPELLLTTYGDPDTTDSGRLMILSASGAVLHDVALPNPGHNGNGNGAPAAPTVGDLDGDGDLEVFVQTFDHGIDVFTVPGSGTDCLLWPTARGGRLRTGRPSGSARAVIFADGFESGNAAAWSATSH